MVKHFQTTGDPKEDEKFDLVYNHYEGFVFNIANKILHNYFDAEDAMQETFLKILLNIKKIDDPRSSKTRGYVATIAERTAIDLYRSRKWFVSWESIEDKVGLSIPPPADDDIARCFSKLPPRYRHILLLKYYYGFTINEIADIFGIKSGTASKLEQRAKARLEELCRKEGIYDLR